MCIHTGMPHAQFPFEWHHPPCHEHGTANGLTTSSSTPFLKQYPIAQPLRICSFQNLTIRGSLHFNSHLPSFYFASPGTPFILKSSSVNGLLGEDIPGTWHARGLSPRLLATVTGVPPRTWGVPKPDPTYSRMYCIEVIIAICPITRPGCGMRSFSTCRQNSFTGSG